MRLKASVKLISNANPRLHAELPNSLFMMFVLISNRKTDLLDAMKNTTSNTKAWSWVAVLSTLIALGLHAYLTVEFYQLKFGVSSGKSLCNVSATFNCEVVAISPYASFLSVPMALWGLMTNLIFLVLFVGTWSGMASSTSLWTRLSLWLSGAIALASVVMGAISATKLGTYCLFCIGTYIASLGTFVGTWMWSRGRLEPTHNDMATLMGPGKVLLLLFVAIPGLAFFGNKVMLDSYGAGRLGIVVQESLNDWVSAKTNDFDPTKGLVYQAGKGDAKVTLVEFVDLLCPHCKAATPTLHAFAESRPDTKLVLKIFPLDGTCNQVIQRKGDGIRCQWSYALFCAEKLAQKGWPALDWIFAHQAELNFPQYDTQLQEMATALQLKLEEMKACMGQSDIQDLVTAMANEGQKAELQGTPAIYLNGRKVDRGQALPVLDGIYKKAKE